jgi:DNA-binding Lrp family transcriptional regulator
MRESEIFTPVECNLLGDYQHDFPLEPRPYAAIAETLGTTEETVLALLRDLQDDRFISRIGAVLTPHRAGWSTLAAMAVSEDSLDRVADIVSAYPEVNHNYSREHRINLWFVVTGPDRDRVTKVIAEIEDRTGIAVLDLPLVEAYRLELGFPLQWN